MVHWTEVADDANGTLYRISDTPYGVEHLEWSPDGRYLWLQVATGEILGMFGTAATVPVMVRREDHGVWTTKTTGDTGCGKLHDWSPDGSRLAFIRDRQLWLASADGQEMAPRPFPPESEGVSEPLFSPDGSTLAVLSGRLGEAGFIYDVWQYDLMTDSEALLLEEAGSGAFAWSPSGDALAHLGAAGTTAIGAVGSARLGIAELAAGSSLFREIGPLPGAEGCLAPPMWALDGENVVVTIHLQPGVWLVDRQGNVQELAGPPVSHRDDRLLPAAFVGASSGWAVVSPDGYYVVYEPGGSGRYIQDLRSGQIITLAQFGSVTWSPVDPRFVNWVREYWADFAYPLDLVDARDGNVQQLDSTGLWPAWSPDGRRIAYWRVEEEGLALWLVNLETSQRVRLTPPIANNPNQWFEDPYVRYPYRIGPRWSPDGRSIAFISLYKGRPEAYLLELDS